MKKILTLGIIRKYVLEYFPDILWWDGYNKHETFNPNRNYKHRQGMPNEIRIEFDYEDVNKNWKAVSSIAIELNRLGYSFAIYSTDGGRGPHIHIYDLDELECLDEEKRTLYREKFLNKVCKEYKPDMELCNEKHLCALEFVNHFKYNKPKELLQYFDNGRNMSIDYDIKSEILFYKNKNNISLPPKRNIKFGDLIFKRKRDLIISKCSFETVFNKYNINYKHHMALCPFHKDTNYSLSFSTEKGLWKCFGCHSKGDIITLIKLLQEVKNGRK